MLRLLAALVLLLAIPASAAEITRIASSFEEKKPFGIFLDIAFERTQDRGKITREWYQDDALKDVNELRYQLVDTQLKFDAHVGIWRDLEFHFGLPIVFQYDRTWGFTKGTGPENTTIYRNCQDASGAACATPGMGSGRLFEVGERVSSFRGGLGNLTFGLAYAFFNQAKDDTKPTWIVGLDYQAPTAAVNNPSKLTSPDQRGAIGDKFHRYKFYTTISKRIGRIDPYFQLHYTLPFRGPGTYSNCDDPSKTRLGRPENCGVKGWDRGTTGTHAPHTGGFLVGTEVAAFERPARHQKVAFDLRAFLTYVSEGRTNNELSDLFGKMLQSSDYAQVGGQFGFVGQAAEFISIKGNASLAYNTEHFLTNERVGQDFSGNGLVDLTQNPDEQNPLYDARIDAVGRRFRIAEQFVFKFEITASFNF